MDEAPLRRGKQTLHKKWDLNTGILSGDAMLIYSYQLLESYPAMT
ncbi:MAG: polyprenyl synthetase family protein, partial [Arenibacter sp.]